MHVRASKKSVAISRYGTVAGWDGRSQPLNQVTAVIPGTGNAEHMIDNLGAGRGRMPDAQQREKMAALLNS